MQQDPIRGKTLTFTFEDGPMARKSIDHSFAEDGTLSWHMSAGGKSTKAKKCEIATIGRDVHAVSYLSDSGYTVTVILDFETGRLTAFSSNEKELGVQHGQFEEVDEDQLHPVSTRSRTNGHAHARGSH